MTPPQDVKSAVLRASLELIEEDGLMRLSMREVARRAGLSHQAPYHHFGDREGILAALAEQGFKRLYADMTASQAKESHPGRRLEAIGTAHVMFALKNPSLFKIMYRAELDFERHDAAQKQAQACTDLLDSAVADFARHRGLTHDPKFVIAAWCLSHGLSTLALEGVLDRYFGKDWRGTRANVAAVFQAFGALLRPQAQDAQRRSAPKG
jgi:AcrR family transcriptional regulator